MTLRCWESSPGGQAVMPEHLCPNTYCDTSCSLPASGTRAGPATRLTEELVFLKRKHSAKPLPPAPAFGFICFFYPGKMKSILYLGLP